MVSVGYATLDIIPSMKGIESKINAQLAGTMGATGKRAGDQMATGVRSSLGSKAKSMFAPVAAGIATIGVGRVIKDSVQLEAAFSKTMNVIRATTGEPAAAMERLSDLAMKLGADTSFSANQASEAMLELARGGISAAQIEAGALAGTLTLAAAGELQMGEAANFAVKAMGQFNLAGKDMDAIAASLAGSANASSASVRDMATALAQGGLAANSVGFSIQETTGILAAFSNAGLEGSDAGTSLKTMLDRLQPTTTSQKKAMQALGVVTEDGVNQFIKANGEFRSAAEIAEVLRQSTEGLDAAERKRLITQAFGSDAQRAATILAKEGADGIREMVKATSDQNAAQEMAKANMEGTAGALERMSGSIETAQLGLGRGLAPTVQALADDLADFVSKAPLEQWGRDLGDGVMTAIDTLKGLRPVAGASLEVLKALAPVVETLGKAFNNLPDGAQQMLVMAGGVGYLNKRLGGTGSLLPGLNTNMLALGQNTAAAGTAAHTAGGRFGGFKAALGSAGYWAAVAFAIDEGAESINGISAALTEPEVKGRKLRDTLDAISGSPFAAYAADLDIDLEKLARSFQRSGEQGAYVQEVMSKLSDDIGAGGWKAAADQLAPFDDALGKVGIDLGWTSDQSLKAAGALRQLMEALNDAKDASKGGVETPQWLRLTAILTNNTDLLREYRKQLVGLPRQVATKILTPGALESTDDVTKLAKRLDLTPKQVRTTMRILDFASDDIKKVVARLDEADKKRPKPKIDADPSQGFRAIDGFMGAMGRADRAHATGTVDVNASSALSKLNMVKSAINAVTGSFFATIYTNRVDRKAAGGLLRGPGTGTSDSIPILASNGEYVVKAAAVNRYGVEMLNAINQQRYADGGQVGRTAPPAAPAVATTPGLSLRDLERFADRFADRVGERIYAGARDGVSRNDASAYRYRRT